MALREPDDNLVVLFRQKDFKNEAKSLAEGRPVHDDIEICEIRVPGSIDVKVFPATEISRWITDPMTGADVPVTYAERFSRQYMQFKAKAAQTKSGTPLEYATFLTAARRAELRAQNVYTVEQLAAIEGNPLKNLGLGGREMKNSAEEYLAESKAGAPTAQMAAELEALRARNAVLEEDYRRAASQRPAPAAAAAADDDYDEMTIEQLREYITTHTGIAPTGSISHKTLKRMAQDIKPNKAA
jgi:hypothetical protein